MIVVRMERMKQQVESSGVAPQPAEIYAIMEVIGETKHGMDYVDRNDSVAHICKFFMKIIASFLSC